jgi:hypothetical protein
MVDKHYITTTLYCKRKTYFAYDSKYPQLTQRKQ